MSRPSGAELVAALRTLLFVPAHEPAKLQKALGAPADGVILDLEDGVPATAKAAAREAAVEALRGAAPDGPALLVRVNDPRGDVGAADLAAIEGLAAAAVVPKAAPETLAAAGGTLPLVPLVESAAGFAAVGELGRAPRVARMMLGSLDLAADVGLVLTPEGTELAPARWSLVLASRQAGLAGPIDGVYPHHRDEDGLRREARAGRNAGMRAKACIHPGQLAAVGEIFAPSEAELSWAGRVVEAWQAAGDDAGAIDVDGEMVDAPVVLRARAIRAAAPVAEAGR